MIRICELRPPRFLRWTTALIWMAYARVFLRFRRFNEAPLPEGPLIVAANHPTSVDPFLIYAAFPNAKMLINADVFLLKGIGWILSRLNHIRTNKREGREAYETAKREVLSGTTVVLFPEGGISERIDRVGSMKTGVIRLAMETRAPVVPIGVCVERRGVRDSCLHPTPGIRLHRRWYCRGRYRLSVGRAIQFEGDSADRRGRCTFGLLPVWCIPAYPNFVDGGMCRCHG